MTGDTGYGYTDLSIRLVVLVSGLDSFEMVTKTCPRERFIFGITGHETSC